MYRPMLETAPFITNLQPIRWQDSLSRLLVPLLLLISVCGILKYGYFEDGRVLMGPGSSRLIETNTLFLRGMEVRDRDKRGVVVYRFSDKPQLRLQKNWNFSNSLTLPVNGEKGFFLWLNKGSRVYIRLEERIGVTSFNQIRVNLIKDWRLDLFLDFTITRNENVVNTGEKYRAIMKPTSPVLNATHLYESTRHGMKSEYYIEEDNVYYVTIANLNTINNISTTISINVASKMYDITKAESTCDSSSSGSCRFHLGLAFPTNKFFVLVSPSPYDGGDDNDGWYVELSFIARLITYIAILGFVVIVALIILRYFGACNLETDEENYNVHTTSASVSTSEVDPLIQDKTYRVPYGTRDEDEDDDEGSSSSGEDLYDGKICVICYDMMRNCFFVPCGHCATCHNCALRIMEGETKVCPICRRLIHKVRKLLIP